MRTQQAPDVGLRAAEVDKFLQERKVDVVEAWTADIHGIARGKRFPAGEFAHGIYESGYHMADAILCWGRDCNLYEDVAFSNSATGYPDLTVVPIPGTLHAMPWREGHAAVLCRVTSLDGSSVDVDPRTILARQVDELEALGSTPRAALEYEFYLLSSDGAVANPVRDCYAFALPEQIERFLERVMRLEEFGLPMEAVETEWGTSQIEVTMRPRPAVEAADLAVMFKAAVKAIAIDLDMIATFMPKLDPADPGSGVHVNQSLWDVDGTNLFGPEAPDPTLRERYLAGLLATASEFFLLAGPSVNAYKRRVPGAFAPTTVTWSRSSRTAAVRAIFDRGSEESRIEYRMPGADANPYLALAASLAGGLHGLRNGLSVPEELQGNSYVQEEDLPQLPSTLSAAVDGFATSEIARSSFGDAFVQLYATLIGHEDSEFAAHVTDWERTRYLRFA